MQATALFAAAALSMWAAIIARTRRGVPGGLAFGWMMLAIALWSFTSAMHTLIEDREIRIVIAKLQYFGVAPVGVLWLLFTAEYSRLEWTRDRLLVAALGIVPIITLVLALTNEQHYFYWSSIREVPTAIGLRLEYRGGAWYWVHAGYSYLLVLIGTLTLVRGLRRFPPRYRQQTALIIVGALVPWTGNLLYLTGALPAGVDATPLAFTVSGACFTWAIYRHRLFGLVPVARDMVVDNMDDGVLVLDAQRRIVDLNAPAERYTGVRRAASGSPSKKWWRGGMRPSPKSGRTPWASRRSSKWSRGPCISRSRCRRCATHSADSPAGW